MDTKKLRQRILNLAIRGKLVPPNPNDEPASILLERIHAEKERLIQEGKIKRSKKSDSDTLKNKVPFGIPDSWEWTTIGDIFQHNTGKALNKSDLAEGVLRPYLTTSNVYWNTFDFSEVKEMHFKTSELEKCTVTQGDLLVCEGGDIGRAAIWNCDYAICIQNHIHRLRGFGSINHSLYLYFLMLYKWTDRINGQGIGLQGLSSGLLGKLRVPLPPLAEQKRIVTAIEQWFALIDVLENEKSDLQASIQQAKSKILDLAIHGKLVPQDPNDEPAIELLKRINPKFELCDEEDCPYEVPEGWTFCHLQDVFKITMGSSPVGESLNRIGEGIEFHQGKLCFSEMFLGISDVYSSEPIKKANPFSLLLCVRAPVGIVNICNREICIGRGLCALTPLQGLDLKYGFYTLQTCQQDFEQKATGSTFKAIGGDVVKNQIIPLPPHQEQLRIVAKIEELFAVLDDIKKSLA